MRPEGGPTHSAVESQPQPRIPYEVQPESENPRMDEQVGDEGPGVLKREAGVELKDFLDGRMREDRRQQDPDDDIRDREAPDHRGPPNPVSGPRAPAAPHE